MSSLLKSAAPRVQALEYLVEIARSRAASGAGSAVLPLSRTLFVDGGTSATTPNGSIAAPFTTISAALAMFGKPTSAPDANSIVSAVIASATGGYTAEPGGVIAIPAYRNVWLQTINLGATFGTPLGPSTTANVTWANTLTAGGEHPPSEAETLITGLQVTGSITITDDNTVNSGLELIGTTVEADIDGTGAQKLGFVSVNQSSVVFGAVNAPHSSVEVQNGSSVSGAITCKTLEIGSGGNAGPGTIVASGEIFVESASLDGGFYSGPSMRVQVGSVVDSIGTIASAVTIIDGFMSGGTLVCATASISGSSFAAGFQLTATTVTTDAASWSQYLAQGGLPNGATITIVSDAYEPATPSDWAGTAPTTVSAALNRLATAFNGLTPPVKP